MKKALYTTALIAFLSASFTQTAKAQDNWLQGKKGIYSAGLGGTQVIVIGNNGYYANPYFSRTSNTGLSLNISGEYQAWKWIGVGFETGLDFIWPHYGYTIYGVHYGGTTGSAAIGIPIGAKANAHIMDALGLAISNKLDVYGGLNLGAGPLFSTASGGGVNGFIHVGPQVGARYWFSKVAVFAEFGWGATFANVGVTF